MRTERLTADAMPAHLPAWAALAGRALEPNLFGDPAFALPAALHLPGRRPTFLLAWADDSPTRLIGLCPIAPLRLGLPMAAWLHPQATAAFPLLDADRAEVALRALLAQARSALHPPGLMLFGLPAEGPTLRLLARQADLRIATIEERQRAVLRFGPTGPTGKAAKEFRRQARRLADQGTVSIVSATTPEDVRAAVDAFLALEAAGWKGRRGTALGQTAALRTFVHAMTRALAVEGRCRVDSLRLDDRPIAAGLVLRSGDAAYFWKTAYDESFARVSPGAHLADAIGRRQLEEPGIALTDSCALPGHTMIDRLWPERMPVADFLVAPAAHPALMRWSILVEAARRTGRRWAKRTVGRLRR